jgi:hypothetical protein
LDYAMRRRRMRWIAQAQQGPPAPELNLIAIKQRRRFADPLVVDERAVKALEIGDRELITASSDLGVTARNHGGIGIDDDFPFGIATKARHFFVQSIWRVLSRSRINQVQDGGPLRRRRTRKFAAEESESSAPAAGGNWRRINHQTRIAKRLHCAPCLTTFGSTAATGVCSMLTTRRIGPPLPN